MYQKNCSVLEELNQCLHQLKTNSGKPDKIKSALANVGKQLEKANGGSLQGEGDLKNMIEVIKCLGSSQYINSLYRGMLIKEKQPLVQNALKTFYEKAQKNQINNNPQSSIEEQKSLWDAAVQFLSREKATNPANQETRQSILKEKKIKIEIVFHHPSKGNDFKIHNYQEQSHIDSQSDSSRFEDLKLQTINGEQILKDVYDSVGKKFLDYNESQWATILNDIKKMRASLEQLKHQTEKNEKTIEKLSSERQRLLIPKSTRQVGVQKDIQTTSKCINACVDTDDSMTNTMPFQKAQVETREHLFAGNLFSGFFSNKYQKKIQSFSHQRRYLVSIIQKFQNRKIMNTRLLYHYDSLNLNNFHDYIDEHPHLVVVIKLTNGMILCGYSTEPFIKGQINYGSGFIASLTNECLYFMDDRKNNKLTTYDPFFIIFGNSEIRLKIPETKVYSNLGIVNRYFQTNEKTPEKLFGSPERDNEAEQYEIYSVYFDSF